MKRYRRYCIRKLSESWPELDKLKLNRISEADCKEWAGRLAKELDGAHIGNWYRRPDLSTDEAASMESRAQQVSLAAHEVGRRLDVVSHQLRTVRPPRRVPPPGDG